MDEQNERINVLEQSIDSIAIGPYVPEVLEKMKNTASLGPTAYTGLATGENILTIKLGECTLLFNDFVPKIFCIVEFYQLKPQTTAVKQGLSVDFGFAGQFRVDVSDQFLEYLASGYATIELRQVVMGAQHKLIGVGKILFSDFFNEKTELGGLLELKSPHGDQSVGGINYKVSVQGEF